MGSLPPKTSAADPRRFGWQSTLTIQVAVDEFILRMEMIHDAANARYPQENQMAKSPEEMAQTMINNLKEKTGKSLPEWLKFLKPEPFEKHGQIVKFLKTEHGVTHGFANLIATGFLKGPDSLIPSNVESDDLVSAQYAGGKAELKPIYDAIIAAVTKFGDDVVVSPKKAYVSLRRTKQFAIVQPTTKTRVDVGINLKEFEADGRLETAGSFNTMVSHRVKILEKKEVNAELKKWLKLAYENA